MYMQKEGDMCVSDKEVIKWQIYKEKKSELIYKQLMVVDF